MSEDGKDYSDYIQHISTLSSLLSLLAGFTFTTTTILLTLLPEPSLFLAQVALFLLISLFSLLGFLIKWTDKKSLSSCRNLPKSEGGIESPNVFNLLFFASDILFAVVVLLMFLLFNLLYLAVASAVVQASFLILSYIVIWKPVFKIRKKPPSHNEIKTQSTILITILRTVKGSPFSLGVCPHTLKVFLSFVVLSSRTYRTPFKK